MNSSKQLIAIWLSIKVEYYCPGTAAQGKVDFSIPARKSLTIGFGDSGTPPYKYFLRKNQTVDVGFLKLCLSTDWIDHGSIAQLTPFHSDRPLRGIRPQIVSKKRWLWDTLIIPVVQKIGAESFGYGNDK